MRPRGWRGRLGRQALVLLVIVYCLFPIYFVLVQSLKTAEEDVFGNPLIVLHPTLENFEELFVSKGGPRGFVGTVLAKRRQAAHEARRPRGHSAGGVPGGAEGEVNQYA